jgi:hypothetical protein
MITIIHPCLFSLHSGQWDRGPEHFKTELSSSERLDDAVLDEKCFLPEDQLVDGP